MFTVSGTEGFVAGFLCGILAVPVVLIWGASKQRLKTAELVKELQERKVTHKAEVKSLTGPVPAAKVEVKQVQCHLRPSHVAHYSIPVNLVLKGVTGTTTTMQIMKVVDGGGEELLGTVAVDQCVIKKDKENALLPGFTLSIRPITGRVFTEEKTHVDGEAVEDIAEVLLKFKYPRDLDRWVSLCTPTKETQHWRSFVRSLQRADVLNVLAGRVFLENRRLPELRKLLTKKLAASINEIKLKGGGSVELLDAHFGDELPIVTNVGFFSCAASGEFAFDLDLNYRGGFHLELRVRPKSLPTVAISVFLEELVGRLHIHINPPPSNRVWLGFHEMPRMELDVKHHIGDGKTSLLAPVLSLLPHLEDWLLDRLKVVILEDCILPYMDDIPIPNLADTPPSTPQSAPIAAPSANVPGNLTLGATHASTPTTTCSNSQGQPQWSAPTKATAASAPVSPAGPKDSPPPASTSPAVSPLPSPQLPTTPSNTASTTGMGKIAAAVQQATERQQKESSPLRPTESKDRSVTPSAEPRSSPEAAPAVPAAAPASTESAGKDRSLPKSPTEEPQAKPAAKKEPAWSQPQW